MDSSSRPLYYDLQNSLPIGVGMINKTSLMQDTSGYNLPASGANMVGGYPMPSSTGTSTPGNLDVTMMVQCSSTDVVVVVGRMSWQCCTCQENHGLDDSIDKHMTSKHSFCFEHKSLFGGGGCDVIDVHAEPLHTFQETNTSRVEETYRGDVCSENKLLHSAIQNQISHSDATQTAVSLLPTVDEQTSGGGNSRSGLEREVALLMAQTFTQASETLPQKHCQKSLNGVAQTSAYQQSGIVSEEKGSVEEKPEASSSMFSTADEQARGKIFGKLIDKVEKAISYVVDTEAQNGLLLVATQLARMKAQAKSKRSKLKQDHSYINCPQCGKEVRNKKAYIKQHNRSHEKGKEFRCSVCNKMFKYRSTLRRHVQQQGHSGGFKDEGDVTAAEFISSLLENSRHERESTATSELSAADVWDTKEEINDEVLSAAGAHQLENNLPQNQTCEQLVSGEPAYEKILAALLAKGEQARSPNGKKLSLVQCFVCDREIRNRNYYITRHARCHTDDMLYTCTSCQQQFFRSDYFQQHLLQHGSILSKATESGHSHGVDLDHEGISKMQEDGSQAHPASASMPTLRRSLRSQKRGCNSKSKPSTVPCKICGKDIFNRTYNIKRHARQHSIFEWETILNMSSVEVAKNGAATSSWKSVYDKLGRDLKGKAWGLFQCQQCGRSFKKYADKRRHMMQHRSTFTCAMCQEMFESYASLRSHQQACRLSAGAHSRRKSGTIRGSTWRRQQAGKVYILTNTLLAIIL